jgi:hypothetical protein
MRDRARDLITQELGPRTDYEIRAIERQVEAERWTNLDRQLARDGYRTGVIDMAPSPDRQPDEFHALKVGRLRKLETSASPIRSARPMGAVGQGRSDAARMGERDDIIKRIHRGLTDRGIERGAANTCSPARADDPIVGRLVDRGLDDELHGLCRGRRHRRAHAPHQAADLDATGDSRRARSSSCASSMTRRASGASLAVRSDLDIERRSMRRALPGSTGRPSRASPRRWARPVRRRGAPAMDAAPTISAKGLPSGRARRHLPAG